jgi:complement component 1 Q subcomponent-binding protein
MASRLSGVIAAPSTLLSAPALSLSSSFNRFGQQVRFLNADRELVTHLKEEISEEELPAAPALPEGFEVTKDTPGNCTVELKRFFEDEEITVRIALEPPPDSYPDEEQGLEDMAEEAGVDPNSEEFRQAEESVAKQEEDALANKEEEEENNPYQDQSLSFTVLIHKPKLDKTLVFEMLSDQGVLFMNGFSLFNDGKLPFDRSAEGEMRRAFNYQGPTIADLPVGLRSSLGDYLDRRGINDDIAKFVLEYVWYKEQNEYVRLLTGMAEFVKPK